MRDVTNPGRRRILWGVGSGLVVGVGLAAGIPSAAAEPRIIELTARRFTFTPSEIALKAGEAVVIAVRSMDFMHGMSLPDLHMRLDLVPGRVSRLELQPSAPGVIEFLCDNFCGDGHGEMRGRFVVSA